MSAHEQQGFLLDQQHTEIIRQARLAYESIHGRTEIALQVLGKFPGQIDHGHRLIVRSPCRG